MCMFRAAECHGKRQTWREKYNFAAEKKILGLNIRPVQRTLYWQSRLCRNIKAYWRL